MKFLGVITAATLVTGMFGTNAFSGDLSSADVQSVLQTYEQQVGYQRRVILEERKALDQAVTNRDNSVHISKDLLNTVAYGVSAGFLTYDFLRGTNNMQAVRNVIFQRKVSYLPPEASVASHAEEEASSLGTAASSSEKALIAREVGVAAWRTTEAVSAAALAVFFVGNIVDTGKDLTIRFKDTDEIRAHRAKLEEAKKNLDAADQNLEVAVQAEQQG